MESDIVVVGAGPAGSMTAKMAAQSGARVLMIEEHQAIGTPVHCGEVVPEKAIEEVGVIQDPKWFANRINGGYLVTPKGIKVSYSKGGPTGLIIERKIFDKSLAIEAGRAGGEIMLRTRAIGVIKEGSFVKGIRAVREGVEFKVESKVVVAADGVQSKVARWSGLETIGRLGETMSCYQYEMVGVHLDEPDMLELFYGNTVAPLGYAWIIPKGKDVANVGVGVGGTAEYHAVDYLNKFLMHNNRFSQAKIVEVKGGAVPVGGPLDRLVCNGLIVVGTAAHLVEPFAGGGIASALRSGVIAGRVAGKAIKDGSYDSEELLVYQREVMEKFGNRWKNLARFRKVFDKMSDDELEDFLKLLPELREALYRGKEADLFHKISFIIRKAPKLAKFLKLFLKQ